MPDGCGGTLRCGNCPGNQVCGARGLNRCGPGACSPTTCDALGKDCGILSDGCGGVLDCGRCPAGETCGGGGVDDVCACQPTTCGALGKTCGDVADGCGGTLHCGTCAAPMICGADHTCRCSGGGPP
jgi:hypothetical protein